MLLQLNFQIEIKVLLSILYLNIRNKSSDIQIKYLFIYFYINSQQNMEQENENNLLNIIGYPDINQDLETIQLNAAESIQKDQSNFGDNDLNKFKSPSGKIEELRNALQKRYPQAFFNVSEIGDGTKLVSFPLEIYQGVLITQFEITINLKKKQINAHVYFADKDGRIIVHQKLLRLQMCRYMLRLNNNLRVGSFFINPVFGHLGLNLQCLNNKSELFFQTSKEIGEFEVYMDSLIVTAIHSLRFHFMRILFMINKINIKLFRLYEVYIEQVKYPQEPTINWRKFPKDAEQTLYRIKQIVKNNMHLEFNKSEYDQYGPILQKQVMSENKCLIEILPTNLNELEIDQKFHINEGGFCNIYSKDIFYQIIKDSQTQQQAQKRPLVIKTDKSSAGDRVKKEADIVARLSETITNNTGLESSARLKYFKFSGCCPYIAQFYYVKQRQDILLMERYYHSSLDYFKAKQQEVLSLSTRIFIAHSIAMGLRYIHNYGIIHMDIKPANILIAKTLMAKITDFGEALNTNKNIEKEKPGKTLPFSAPEMQQKVETSKFTYAYDIYSFGVLFFELLFDRYPIDFRKQNFKPLEDKLQKLNYFVRYDEEYDKLLGPQVLMKYLGRLCLQCLQPDPTKRPNIDKIILVLKDCLTYLDKVY
ncbi:unnamed protein product [Paramecium sonneborni]|uniref:Protein kinase domain-containing protein n=1 Tax=Paramecium sonneborni TaxID=65129 RepID=A0A8S1R5M1_9CILI|nr:unnamed protein product [Paramecium sonneborni]